MKKIYFRDSSSKKGENIKINKEAIKLIKGMFLIILLTLSFAPGKGEKNSKLNNRLTEKLARMDDQDTSNVLVFLNRKLKSYEYSNTAITAQISEDGVQFNVDGIDLDSNEVEEYADKNRKRRKKMFLNMDKEMGKIIKSLDVKVKNKGFMSFSANMTKKEIMDLALDSIVGNVDIDIKGKGQMYNQMTQVGAYPYMSNYMPFQGNNIWIYMAEYGCPEPWYIPDYVNYNSAYYSDHSRFTATLLKLYAPGSSIICRGGAMDLGSIDLVTYPVSVANISLAFDCDSEYHTMQDLQANAWAYTGDVTVVASAGNADCGSKMGSPGKAYNVLTVGAYNGYTGVHYPFSLYGSSFEDNQKPEVVAPGEYVTAGPYSNHVGTSASTPVLSGLVADIASILPLYKDKPAVMKALAISASYGPVSGGIDKVGYGRPNFGGMLYYNTWGFSLDLDAARYQDYMVENTGSFNGSIEKGFQIWYPGTPYRAVLNWLVDPEHENVNNGGCCDYKPGVLWDLRIYDPNGNLIESAYQDKNTHLVIDFTPTMQGEYKFQFKKSYSGNGHTEAIKIGLAVQAMVNL